MKGVITAAVVAWLLGSCVPGRAGDAVPCDADRVRTAADAGWRVQVDPETGIYTLPTAPAAPETKTMSSDFSSATRIRPA